MRAQLWRAIAGLLVATVLASIAVVISAGPAAAHADLVSTSPRADQVLDTPPGGIELIFSDSIDLDTSVVRVVEPNGAVTDGLGALTHVGDNAASIAVDLPDSLSRGTRSVVYRVVSTDGHPVQGAFQFSVGVATASAAPDVLGETDDLLGLGLGIARWVAFVGLALALGTLLLVFTAWPAGLTVSSVRRLLWIGLGSLSLASLASFALYGPYISGAGIADSVDPELFDLSLGTRVGQLLVLRLTVLALVSVGLYFWLRRSRTQSPPEVPDANPRELAGARPALATLLIGGVLALTWSLATHSADGGGSVLTLPVDLAHMLAMSAWLGGMPALLVLLLRVRESAALSRAVPVFSRTATVCVLTLVATGVLQTWRQVGSADALTSTAYGGWLIVKLALVAGILALGALARWWAAPHLLATLKTDRRPKGRRATSVSTSRQPAAVTAAGTGPFGRLVAIETSLGAVVLAVTATLVSTQPAEAAHRSKQAAASAEATPLMLVASAIETTVGFRLAALTPNQEPSAFVTPLVVPPGPAQGRGFVEAVISPAFGGLPNELHISVTDDLGKPYEIAVAAIDLRAVGGTERSSRYGLRSTGQGHFAAAFTVPSAGKWQLGISVRDAAGMEALILVPFEASPSII